VHLVSAAQRVQYRTGVHVVIMACHLLPGVAGNTGA
jgi:hypothetical protein